MATLWDIGDLPAPTPVGWDVRAPFGSGVPAWLRHVLTEVLRMPRDQVNRLSPEQAREIWDAYVECPVP